MGNSIRMVDKSTLKTGDLLLVRGNSLLSKAIRLFTRSEYNHAGLLWWAYDELFVIEEDKAGKFVGLITTKFDDYLKSGKKLLIRRPVFPVDGSEYGKFMLPLLGRTRYSFWDLIVAQPFYILSGKRVWIGGWSMKDHRTVCSGFCGFVYNHFNTELFQNWYKLAPGDFVNDSNFVDI